MNAKLALSFLVISATIMSTSPANAWWIFSRDKGYRYDKATGTCKNKEGAIGYNYKFAGECGDLSKYSSRKLKRKLRKGKIKESSLRGAQIVGLNLKGAQLAGIDFTGANFRGTNLENANIGVFSPLFEKAQYDSKTVLPFSEITAKSYGMIKIGPAGLSSIFEDPTIILTVEDIEGTLQKIKSIASPTEDYHQELYDILKGADSIDASHLKLIVDAHYYNVEKIKKLKEDLQAASNYDEIQRLQDIYRSAIILGKYNNQALADGLKILSDGTQDNIISLLKLAIKESISGDDDAKNPIKESIEFLLDTYSPLSKENLINISILAANFGMIEKSIELAMEFFDTHTDQSLDSLGKTVGLLPKSVAGQFILEGLKKFDEITTDELITISELGQHYTASIIMANLIKVSDRTIDNAIKLASKVSYNNKDKILGKYLETVKTITTDSIMLLSDAAYANKVSIITSNLQMISDLDLANVIKLTEKLSYNSKDTVVDYYIKNKVEKGISTQDILKLSKAAYNIKTSVVIGNLKLINDMNFENAVFLAGQFSYNTKDTIVLFYVDNHIRGKNIEAAKLLELSQAAYNQRTTLVTENLNLISDWTQDTAIFLAGKFSYNTKDKIIGHYLENHVSRSSIDARDLYKLAAASYNQKTGYITDNFEKIRDWSVETAIYLSSKFTYNTKDKIINHYVTKVAGGITTVDILKLSNASYNGKRSIVTDNLTRIIDMNVENTLKIAAEFSYQTKDTIVLFYMDTKALGLSTDNLIRLARKTYHSQKKVLTEYLDKVGDLTVSNAIKLAGELSYNSKDTLLLKAVELVTDLSKDNLMKLAEAAHTTTTKNTIMKKGLERLP